jgi:hypothetical protein
MNEKMIDELRREIKKDVSRWEEALLEWVYKVGRQVAVVLLKEMDDALMRERGEGLKVEGCRGRWVMGVLGDMRIERRMYQDEEGEYRYLLDEALGLKKGCQVSPWLESLATCLASYMPYGKCEEVLGRIVPGRLSHTTIHRLVGRVIDPYVENESKEVAEVFEDGVVPESEGRVVSHLMIEGDGASIVLQREEERRAEVKVGIAYEGWEAVGKGRYRLKEKTTYAGIMNGEEFWDRFSLQLAKRYDLAQIGQIIVGGDGADWVKEGAEVFGGLYQLDRFHLLRALRRGLSEEAVGPVYQACVSGDLGQVDGLLRQAQAGAGGEQAREIAQLRGYILHNAGGLKDYRWRVDGGSFLRGMGTIESNIDKLVASRMKKRGMSWTKRGGDRMVRLINLREQGELHQWVKLKPRKPEGKPALRFRLRPDRDGPSQDKYHTWLEANLPALSGPHGDRPWAHILRTITQSTHKRR